MSIYTDGIDLAGATSAYDDFLGSDDEEIDPEFVEYDEQLRDIAPDFVEQKKETATARKYRLKAKHGLNFLLNQFVQHPKTVADAAAIIEYGPQVSRAVGELADADKRVARAIDFLTDDGIDNPYILAGFAIVPLAMQVIRNHEQALTKEIKPHIRIPFTRREIRLPFKFSFKLKFIKTYTAPPETLTEHVFNNPVIREAFAKRDIKIAWQPNYMSNGRG